MQEPEGKMPSGQRYVKDFIVYAAMGIPRVDISTYKLEINGLVEHPFSLTFQDLEKMVDSNYTHDFHCVTRWSIKDVTWTGVRISALAERAGVKEEADWIMFHCLDGYDTPVPVEDAMDEKSIVAIRMNGKPIPQENGFPVRPFIPHLYGWKSAKWLSSIEFIKGYEDGYWEAYGYHDRGNVWEEERFKGSAWKRIKRTVFRKE